MRKHLELSTPTSCLNKAADDEPLFVLRANDPIAAQTIRFWAAMAMNVHEEPKRRDARQCAEEFEEWRKRQEDRKKPQAAEAL